ncbi:MAG: DUF2950 domain-containing protein [Acidobacteriia bacterium]|nr:DUF2950 domain-containing protein [Terriglobia bacterium]
MKSAKTQVFGGERNGKQNKKGQSRMGNPRYRNPLSILKGTPSVLLFVVLFSFAFGAGVVARGQSQAAVANPGTPSADQQTFSTPEDASQALLTAIKAKDSTTLAKIFGPGEDQLRSGDPVEDNNDLDDFAKGLDESAKLRKDSDTKYTLLVGENSWPMPIPIVKQGTVWYFDTKAGLDEILNRRIGDNELSAVATARAYVVAQWEYFTAGDHDNDGVAEYAQKLFSSPGQKDGLYWPTADDQEPSPLGALIADARTEGYGPKARTNMGSPKPVNSNVPAGEQSAARPRYPYRGYYFKILTKQGPSAPGGQYNYIINGNMIAGFALVAYPAKWGNSGVMTIIVNQQGRVYQKNLGPSSDAIATTMTEYNPDPTWQLVQP